MAVEGSGSRTIGHDTAGGIRGLGRHDTAGGQCGARLARIRTIVDIPPGRDTARGAVGGRDSAGGAAGAGQRDTGGGAAGAPPADGRVRVAALHRARSRSVQPPAGGSAGAGVPHSAAARVRRAGGE
eukprot:scaffold14686_cov84-Isochrysis_galbana.AAC.1